MELLAQLPILFPFLLLSYMLVKKIHLSISKNLSSNLPPGPPKLPLIGNLHQLTGSLPHHTLRDLAKKHGPLMHLRLGQVSTIVVSSPEIAKEVFKTHDVIFAQRPQLLASKILSYDYTDIEFAPYGKYWRQMRKIFTTELLSPDRVISFQSVRELEVSNLIQKIKSSAGSIINLSEKIFSLTNRITLRSAFGKRSKDQDKFLTIFTELTNFPSGLSIADMFPSIGALQHIGGMRDKLEKMHQEADRLLQDIVNDHKQSRSAAIFARDTEENLVDVFLKLQEQGDLEFPVTDDNIKAVLLEIFTSGSETSATTLEWAMSEMLKNPRVMKEAQAEVRWVFEQKGTVDETELTKLIFLKAVIKETLRLHPPLPLLLPRESSEHCKIFGYDIPAKTRLIVNAWAIGRDPKFWRKPDRFRPERFLGSSYDYKGTHFQFIPFGSGRRVCPGIGFALVNIELPLAQLLYHFDWKRPDGLRNDDLDMSEAAGWTVRRKEDLFLIPTPNNSLPVV